MTYLLQYVRPESAAPRARIDECTRLNRPGLYGDAHVRVYVEDTTADRRRRSRSCEPRIELQIADCVNEINLEFSLATDLYRENSLFKIDTLLGALHRFRDALAEEAALRAHDT